MKKSSKEIVFLICSERSGSNLISTILNTHSQISSASPYHFFRDFGLNLPAIKLAGIKSQAWNLMKETLLSRMIKMGDTDNAQALNTFLDQLKEIDFKKIAHFMYFDLANKPEIKIIFVKENTLHSVKWRYSD